MDETVRVQPNMAASRWQRVSGNAARFLQRLSGMCLVVLALALIEVAAVWWIGAYEPTRALRTVRTDDFSFSADGRWAVSRIYIFPAALESPAESSIFVHDMQHPDRAVPIDVGRSDLCGAAISPTGDLVAFTTRDGVIGVANRRRADESPRTIAQVRGGLFRHPSWSPDGRLLAATDDGTVFLWAMPSGELMHEFRHDGNFYPSIAFSSDSRTLLSAGADATLNLWDTWSGELKTSTPAPAEVTSAALGSGGRTAAFTAGGGLFVWDLEHGEELWSVAPISKDLRPIKISLGDTFLATVAQPADGGRGPSRVAVYDIHTGRRIWALDSADALLMGATFAPDGTLCFWGEDGVIAGWHVETQREAWRLTWDARRTFLHDGAVRAISSPGRRPPLAQTGAASPGPRRRPHTS